MVKLNMMERLMAMQLLPQEGDMVTLKIVRDLQNTLAPSEKEFKEFEFKQVTDDKNNSTYTWNKKGSEKREIEIGDKGKEIISDALKKLDEKKKLTLKHESLYDAFIGTN